ncbi:glyoxalase [Aestuariibacter sp. AA17]|uniref:Glyoxalase n=1 Tax=Fluctibacter corallii TaxID=2984329 RepID=A0ABT3A7D5_9ALTE|nr:glyoxalase [Aestuariibacter sp. AA17]MCV2884592.1 glyoxalase [Aestuariibacter sp. AA17]
MQAIPPFHLAIPVTSLAHARAFYGELLGCSEGRSDDHWIDWDFYGHQLVTHLVKAMPSVPDTNVVDEKHVPVPHFGVVLPWKEWHSLADTLDNVGTDFVIAPYIRFKGQPGEQATMFLHDPSGNALEFKAFRDLSNLFSH